MGKTEEYRQLAAECIHMAQEADNAGCKITLIDMAGVWLRLADQAEKNSHLDLVYDTPARAAVLPQ